MKQTDKKSGKSDKSDETNKPYGFVLVLRGLARAAIMLSDHPAALRVLCIAAEYMNQDGDCRISQSTIAARLDISRQAVNRHLRVLDREEILIGEASVNGVTLRYYLNTDGLEDEREGQDRVDERRAAKRAEKEREMTEEPETDSEIAERQAGGTYLMHERIGWRAFGEAEMAGGDMEQCMAAMVAAEKAEGVAYCEIQRIRGCRAFRKINIERPPLTVVAQAEPSRPFAIDDRVTHVKFGAGTVQDIDGTKISVLFDRHDAPKKVVDSFIEHAPKQHRSPERATSEVAGGAT